MTSTNDGKDVKSNQSSGQKGKTYYIELYKSLDARLSGDCDLGSRARHLCEAWRRVHSLCLHALPATHPHLFSWVERHTARTILQTEWQSPKSKDVQTSLEEAIDAYIADTGSASKDGVKLPWELQLQERGEWFKRILRNPWGHDVLRALLQGETPGDDEILGWLKEERGLMFVTRLKQLTASKSKCDDLAMGLVTAVMDRVRASTVLVPDIDQADEPKDKPVQPTDQPTFGDILKAEAGFTGDIWELLTDIEFVLLHKCDRHSKCIELAKQIPLKNGYHLVERLQSRLDAAPREKRLWKNAKDVATLVAQVIIARCMVIPVCAHICRSALYCCSRSLARLLPAPRLPAAAAALAAPAATARHLHTLAQAVDAQVHQPNQPRNPSSTDMIPFVCELYVRAITAGMNELERLKLKTEKETEGEARTAAAMLASWFTQLGALLARSLRLRSECALTAFSLHPAPDMYDKIRAAPALPKLNRLGALLARSLRLRSECALTAFSLHPAPDMYDKIRAAPALPKLNRDPQEAKEEMTTDFGSWTNDSRTQSNLVKTSETLNMKHTQNQANVLSTAILTEGEAIGLSPELCMDLAVLLAGPRVKTLSWDMDREALLDNCRAYMERTDGGTRALTTELKYLNLDPASYMHLPEENDEEDDLYYGIEKGYEHLVELQEPESVWPEQYDDPEKTESACSSSMENDSGTVRRKKKSKVITRTIDSDEDEDPLSLIAEVKRMEKKKERPHSKERSSKDGSKERKKKTKSKETSDNKEGSRERRKENPDDKEKKKEKRAYKKRTKDSQQVEPKPGSLSSLVGMRVAKPEVNHNKSPDAKVMPYVTDSDYDSQGKSSMASLNSEGNDPDVLFDGLYCMEENVLNDPLGDKNSLTNSELSVANGQVAINTARVVKKPVLDKPQILKPVDKQISKTTQNINNQVKHTPVAANMNNALPYTQGSVEQNIQSTVDLKTQTKNVNAVREHVKQSISRLIEFRRQNALLEAQRNSMSSPSSTASSPRVNSENSSTPIYKSSNVMHNDFPDPPKLPRKVEVAIPDVNKIYMTKNQIESDHKQEVDMKAAKQNKPVIPYSKYNQQQPMNYNEAFLQTFLPKEKVRPVQPQPRIVHKPQSAISDDVSQKNFQAFLKELQETINAGTGTKTTNTALVVPKPAQKKDIRPISRVTPVIPNNMKTEPGSSSQCAKSTIQTAKKADNQLNTFARLSYMHKTKQSDFKTSKETPSLYQEQKALLNKAIEEQKSAKLKYLQSKGEIVVSRVCQAQPNLPVKDEPKVLIKKVDQPSKIAVSDHPLLKNMLHSKSSHGAIPKHAPKQDNIVRNPSHTEMPRVVTPAPVIRETSLSEKDQNDLLLLLRQQNKLNYSTPCINTDVNKTTNNIQYSNPVPASTIPSLNQVNVNQSVIKNYPTEIIQNNTQNNVFTNKATHVVQKMYPKAVENSPDNVSRTIPYKKINVSLTKVANAPTINTEVNQYGDNNKQASKSTDSQEGQTNRQDWESVMDALLKHKTPIRGPNALEMTLNNDGFTHSSLRNQRIMRTNVVDPESKVSDSRIQTQSVLKHTASETIVKPNRIVEGIKTDEKNRQLIQTAKHAVSDRVVRPNVVPDAEVKPSLHTQMIVRPNMMINTEVKTGDNKLHTRSVAKVITDRVVRPSLLRDTGIKTSHSNNPHTYIPAKQFAPENVNTQSLAIDAEVKISDIKKPQTVTRNVITERVARPGLMFNTNHKPDERSKIQPEIKHTTEKILRPNLVMDSQVKLNEPVTVAKHVMPAVIHKKINIHYSANQDSLKNQKPPQTHALKPVIEGEHLKVTDIHKKQVTANLKDSYISSIPNSDYDLLDELMDDELRQEIGELSSDEETYRSSSSNNYKGNKITTSKELSTDKNIKQQDTLHSIDPRCALKPAQSAQNNVIIQAIERTNAPKIIIESDRTIVPAKVVNTERPPVQVSTNIVQQTTANAVVLNNQINESQTFICQNVNRNHINVVNPRNVIITAVPQPVVPNVVVFGSDIVYDPFTTVQTHLQTGLCNVSQTPYITLNTAPNIAVYQTTQFTAPVVNELIIGNAMTSPMPAPATQSITSMAGAQDMSTSQINTTNITEPLKDYCEDVVNDDKNVNNHDNLETKPKIDTDNLLQGKSDVKQPKTSLDINSNKNCERKVLSEVQDKQTIKVAEKVDIKNTINQKQVTEENKREEKVVIPSELKQEIESKIDLESVPKKNSRDQERLKKKRFAILNREVSHRSCTDPIALGYAPLSKPIQRSPVNNNTSQHKSDNKSTPDLVLNNQKVVNEEQDTDNSKENESKETPCRRILLRSSNDLKAVTGLSSSQDQKNPVGRKTKVRLKKTEEHCTNKTMEQKVHIENKDVHKREKIVSPIRVSKRILNKKADKVNVEITNTNVVKPVVITQTHKNNVIPIKNDIKDAQKVDIAKNEKVTENHSKDENKDSNQPSQLIDATAICVPVDIKPAVIPNMTKFDAIDFEDALQGSKIPKIIRNPENDSYPITEDDDSINTISITEAVKKKSKKKKSTKKRSVRVVRESQSDVKSLEILPTDVKSNNTGDKCTNNNKTDKSNVNVVPTLQKALDGIKMAQSKSDECVPTSREIINNANIPQTPNKFGVIVPACQNNIQSKPLKSPDTVNLSTQTLNKASVAQDIQNTKILQNMKCFDDFNKTAKENIKFSIAKDVAKQSIASNNSRVDERYINCKTLKELKPFSETKHINVSNDKLKVSTLKLNNDLAANAKTSNNDINSQSGVINNIQNKTQEIHNTSKNDDLSQSQNSHKMSQSTLDCLKDQIRIEELPALNDSDKKCVRIKMPNGKSFKATVFGKMHVSFESLFSDKHLRMALLNSINDTKRYTVNIKQVSTTEKNDTSKIVETRIEEVKVLTDATPTIETVNLLSDEEDEPPSQTNNKTRTLKTEFGEFNISLEEEHFTKHQMKLQQKCLIKLTDVKISHPDLLRKETLKASESMVQTKNESNKNQNGFCPIVQHELESKKISIDKNDIVKDSNTVSKVPTQGTLTLGNREAVPAIPVSSIPDIIEIDDSSNDSIDVSKVLERAVFSNEFKLMEKESVQAKCNMNKLPDEIDTLKNLLLKDLGVQDIVKDIKTQIQDDSNVKALKDHETSQLCRENIRECYVKLHNCDGLVKKYDQIRIMNQTCSVNLYRCDDDDKQDEDVSDEKNNLNSSDDFINLDVVSEPKLTRSGSFSLLDDLSLYEEEILGNSPSVLDCGRSSPVMEVFDAISCLRKATRAAENHMSVMEAFELIASVQNRDRKELSEKIRCFCELYATKRDLHVLSKVELLAPQQNDPQFDGLPRNSSLDRKHNAVPTLKKLTANVFLDDSVLDLIKPCLKSRVQPPVQSPSHSLKRKIRSGEDKKVVSKLVKVMIKTNIEVIKEENVKAQPNILACQRDNNVNLIEQPLVEEDSTVHTEIKISNECGVKDENVSSEEYAFSSKYVLPEKQNEHSLCKIDKLPGAVIDVSENSTDQAAASNDKTVKCEKDVEDILKSENDQACGTDIGEVVEEIPDKTHVVISSQYSQKRESDKSLDENIEVNKDEEKDLTDNCRLVKINVKIDKENSIPSDQKFDPMTDKNINEEKLENNENNKNRKQNRECVNNETIDSTMVADFKVSSEKTDPQSTEDIPRENNKNTLLCSDQCTKRTVECKEEPTVTNIKNTLANSSNDNFKHDNTDTSEEISTPVRTIDSNELKTDSSLLALSDNDFSQKDAVDSAGDKSVDIHQPAINEEQERGYLSATTELQVVRSTDSLDTVDKLSVSQESESIPRLDNNHPKLELVTVVKVVSDYDISLDCSSKSSKNNTVQAEIKLSDKDLERQCLEITDAKEQSTNSEDTPIKRESKVNAKEIDDEKGTDGDKEHELVKGEIRDETDESQDNNRQNVDNLICSTSVKVDPVTELEFLAKNHEESASNQIVKDTQLSPARKYTLNELYLKDKSSIDETKLSNEFILNGIEYEDPEMGTCYVFPIAADTSSSSCETDELFEEETEEIIQVIQEISEDGTVATVTLETKEIGADEDYKLNLPQLTYSRLSKTNCYTKRPLKRKIDMSDIKISEKKYRKGKNIDYPKITATAMADSAYGREFKRVLEYCSTVKFSYTQPFHKEFIDVDEIIRNWPIGKSICDNYQDDFHNAVLFTDLENVEPHRVFDPAEQTFADEISEEYTESDLPSNIPEINFSMGFGEGSDRVIQNLEDVGDDLKFSAATLSDVKQPQPLLQSENYDERTADHEEISFMTSREDQIKQLKRYLTYIQMRDKVRSFFKKTSMELKYDWIGQEKHDVRNFPFELYNKPDFLEPPPASVIVQVVQVGQLPVSATAQNPVTCDPRVTQVSDASPSQCSVDNSPQDDSQPTIKTEYTELTTADLTVPLMQEYAQHNQTLPMDSQEQTNMSMSDENIPIETEIKSVVKIELVDDTDEKEETRENYENSEPSVPEAKQENEVEYSFDTNSDHVTTPLEAETDYIEMMEYPPEKQDLSEMYPEQQEQKQQNGAPEKTDQIAHAMNAAGITTTSETMTNNTRAHALVNILSQKLRQGSAGGAQATTNTYSKTTSINAMALQQALAQILPPPLNQSNGTENSQQSQNAPQVLHIVQGKNATGSQITLVDNSQQSVINAPNATPVLHIVQNKSGTANANTNGAANQQTNSFGGLSLVDAGLQQGGNQLLHIVNTGSQKNSNAAGQLLKRVNLLTNLTNVQGSNEQKMVQFVCKSADGKAIQLNAPHQRSMVLRLQPIETPNVQATPPKPVESQDLSPTANGTNSQNGKDNAASQQEIKSRSVYEENYAKFIQNSSSKTGGSEKSTSLPKFNQAFGKPVFQDGSQTQNDINANNSHLSVNTKSETSDCQATDNAINLDHIGQISSPPLLLRKSPAQTSQAQTNLVQQLKQTITPMNIQTMHGGVIYTRQIPVNIGGGQTINLITVPSTELVDDSTQKQPVGTQNEMEQSIIKLVPQNQSAPSNAEISSEEGGTTMNVSNENNQNPTPQPVLTQMRIKLPMLSKTPQMVSGTRVVRPSFFQIQRNVIGGTNQPVYQQLVLTAAPPLGQQTIRLPQAQTTRPIKVDNNQSSAESQMSSSTLEQLREFDMVLEQVKERSSVPPNSTTTFPKLHTPSTDTTDGSASTASTETTQQVLYSIGNNHQPLNVAYVNRKATVTTPTTSTFVRSPDSSGIIDSPTSSSHVQIPHTVTSESSHTDPPPTPKPKSKSKSRPKSSSNPPSNLKLNTVPPKTSTQKPLEDEQTTQRILYILAEYKEQVENSPDKDKPAPRRRSNPPSNPSGSSKRKKSSSGSRRHGRDMSPIHGEDTCRTMGSEDSSCGTSQGDCNESCLESHSPQDSPRKVVRKLSFEPETPAPTPRPQQPQRNVIVADGQTITVARGTAGKPATAVLMPANYILPVSMVKGGQQIAIVTNRGPKLLTVGGGEGGATNALLLQRLIGPAGLKPVLARPGVRHVRLPTAALHNLQAFNLATATTIQPPDSTASPAPAPTPPELVDTRATSSPWTDRDCTDVKPERGSSPEGSEPWNLPSSGDPHDYSYEETVRTDHLDRTVLVVQKKDGSSHRQHRLTHVSAAALRHKYAILEHELRLQKSLSEECEDLGVDSPSASELFPEAELLFATSPAHEHQDQGHHSHTPQPTLMNQSGIPHPDMDDQIATDELLPRDADSRQLGLGLGGGVVGVGEDDLQAVALDQEEFARAHPNTTFHSEPEEAEVQPFTIAGLKGRHIPTIFHSNRAPATVLMTAPQTTVISQATGGHNHSDAVKYADIDNMINSLPSGNNNINLSSVLVKDEGLTRFDSILSDSRELHLSNTASAIVHSAGNATQVIRRVCYDDDKRDRFLMDEPDAIIAGDDAKMIAEDSSRDATMESMGGEMDDDRSSPERHAELFWESNSASERSESRRPLDFSSDSEKCCKSPSYDETNSTDSSGGGTHMRLDSVIKDARGIERSGSADGSSADDAHPPLRTYPPKRMYGLDGTLERSMGGKTRAGEAEGEARARRASGRGVVKRGCHCCNGEPAPSRPKKSRQRKPTMDFTTN